MKPKKPWWLISAISLILIFIALTTILKTFPESLEIKLLAENSFLNWPIPKIFSINISNWWNIIFFLFFIIISIGIIYLLEIKDEKENNLDFYPYEEEKTSLRDGVFVGIKIGAIFGSLGLFTVLINPIMTRSIVGIVFTSLTSLLLARIYDIGISVIETRKDRIKNAFSIQVGSNLVISFLIALSSCLRNDLIIGVSIFLSVIIISSIITLSLTTLIIIAKAIKKKIIYYLKYCR